MPQDAPPENRGHYTTPETPPAIARTVRSGDWAGGTAETGEARAHRQTQRGVPARIATAAVGEPC